MVLPFIRSSVHNGDSANSDFAEVVWERCAGSDSAQERVPSICDSWVVEQRKVERLERTRSATCGNAVIDGLVLGGEVGWLWANVWDSHFGGALVWRMCLYGVAIDMQSEGWVVKIRLYVGLVR